MKKPISGISIIFSLILLFSACSKENSIEKGLAGGNAAGELVDSLGNCKRADVQGSYQVDTPLNNTTNYVNINVNFTSQGKYKIYSDTVNGMWFIDSGFTVSTGPAIIKLKGYGTPILPKTSDFTLLFNNNLCTFAITTGGTGGSSGGPSGTKADYFPTTSGSSFIYKYIPALGTLDTFSVKVLPGLVTVGSLNYAQFQTRLGDVFYFAKDGNGTYYSLSTVDFDYTYIFDSVPTDFISYPFLKENAGIGESWATAEFGPVIVNTSTGKLKGTTKAIFTLIAKNGSYTVGGKTYTSVINVKREIMFKAENTTTYTNLLTGNSYYAKDFGLIDQVFTNSSTTSVSLYNTPTIK